MMTHFPDQDLNTKQTSANNMLNFSEWRNIKKETQGGVKEINNVSMCVCVGGSVCLCEVRENVEQTL